MMMTTNGKRRLQALLVAAAIAAAAGCGGGSDDAALPPGPAPAPAPSPGSAVIGAQGGTVRGEAGAEVRIPPDALVDARTIRIARDATDLPPLPPGTALISDVWAITPHDTASRIPMTVRIPFDSSLLRTGERPGVLKGSTDGQWHLIEDVTVEGNTVAVQVRSFSFLVVRALQGARVIPPAGTPPSSTQPSFTVSVENPGFQTLPVSNFTAVMRLQQLPNEPVNVQYSLRVPAGSAANDVCTFGATRNPIYAFRHTIPVAIYRLPGEAASVNRLSAYFRGASIEPLLVNPAGTTEEARYSVLPDRDYVVRQAVSALDYQWRADAGNPFPYTYDWANSLPGELPANATVDSWGVMVKLVISCASGLPAFASTAPPVVIARGFPNDKLFFNGPPTLNAAFPGQLATGQINVTIDPTHVSAGYTWQIRRPGASSWTNVPKIISATQPPGVSIWSGDNAISFVPQASDNGAELRVEACVDPAGSGLGISLLRACYMSPVGRVTVSNQFPTPRIMIQPGPAAFRVNDVFYLRAEYETFPLPQTGAGIVWQTRADASLPWSGLPGAVNDTYRPGPQLPIEIVFRAAEGRNDRGVTTLLREFAQPVTVADRGRQYRVILTLNNTTLTSNVITIGVDSGVVPPRFTVQPVDVQVQAGSATTLTAAVEGGAPLSYRWLFNGQPILGANAPTLSLASVNSANAGSYQLEVSNADATIRSSTARLTVSATAPPVVTAPNIGTQPAALNVLAGSLATFTVTASGTAPLTYQWRRNGSSIAGATSQVLTLPNVSTADAGDYSVVVTNSVGSVTSNNAALVVTTTATPPPVVPPSIGTQPVGLSVNPGQTATFAVAASGTGPLAYQWQRNGSNVSGATSPVLTLANVQSGDAGSYTVAVSNGAGSVTSNPAGLIVAPVPGTPAITAQPGNASAVAGSTATFNATVTGNPTPQCQWTRNGVAIAGAANCASYTTPVLTTADNGTFYNLVAYNTAGAAFGNGAVLTVQQLAAPTITSQPQAASVAAGATASFSVAATSNGPLSYQWRRNGSAIAGATSAAYSLAASTADNGAAFSVRVCTGAQTADLCTISESATLTLTAPGLVVPWQADTRIAGGGTHSLVVRANGELWSWGTNNGGALGRADASTVTAPSAVTTLGNNVRSVAAGAWYSVALRNDGTVWVWGDGDRVGAAVGSSGAIQLPLQVNALSSIRAISTRYTHTLALRDNGTVWGFGPENFSALGPLVGNNAARQIPGLADVRQVAAGEQHSMALLADGTVRTWGSNTLAQLGLNTSFAPRTAPQTVPITDVVAIAATSFASFALRNDGTLWRWGTLAGSNISAPTQVVVSGTSPITKMVPGNYTLHLLRSDNTLFGFGDNTFGRVGTGVTGGTVTVLSQIGLIGNVADVGGGESHTMAVRDDGRVFTWGNNSNRQLNGTAGADANAPQDSGFTR